jgi:hypothetical protein
MEFTIKITEQALMVVLQGLGELPLKVAGPIFTELQNVAMSQRATMQQGEEPTSHGEETA